MELFECVSLSAITEMNDLINEAGGFEEILEWAVLKMQDELVRVRQALSTTTANQKRTQQQYSQAQIEADKWAQRVKLALEKRRSDLAIEALPRQNTNEEIAHRLSIQLDKQTAEVEMLKRNLFNLETKVNQAKQNRNKLTWSVKRQVTSPLETRLRKLESELEAEKAQLLIQQTAVVKSLRLNSVALKEVRDILKEVYSLPEIKLISSAVDNDLEELKKQLDDL